MRVKPGPVSREACICVSFLSSFKLTPSSDSLQVQQDWWGQVYKRGGWGTREMTGLLRGSRWMSFAAGAVTEEFSLPGGAWTGCAGAGYWECHTHWLLWQPMVLDVWELKVQVGGEPTKSAPNKALTECGFSHKPWWHQLDLGFWW